MHPEEEMNRIRWEPDRESTAEPGDLSDEGLAEAFGVTAARCIRISQAAQHASDAGMMVALAQCADLWKEREARAAALAVELYRRGAEVVP